MTEAAASRSSLAWGLRALGQWRLIVLLAAATLLLAAPAALALWPALDSVFGRTLAGDHVLRNHPVLAPSDVLEFLVEKKDVIAASWRLALGGAAVAVLFQIFCAGGFVEVLARQDRAAIGQFFGCAVRNFWHNLKCFAIFAVSAAIVMGAWIAAAGAASRRLLDQTPPGAPSARALYTAAVLVGLLLFALLSLLHDYARIARRHAPTAGAWRGFAMAGRMLWTGWWRALGLLLFWLLVGGIAWLTVLAVEWAAPAVSAAAILAHTFLQVGAVLVRSGVRVGAWASYVAFADRRTPQPAAPTVMQPAPQVGRAFPSPDLVGDTPLI